ncbi:hypothetical protein A3715_17610 [Oleiphilus sp. HI0009]|nr:hypothetical protein A3715_17610 [Oleiphilus sp. HI0009]
MREKRLYIQNGIVSGLEDDFEVVRNLVNIELEKKICVSEICPDNRLLRAVYRVGLALAKDKVSYKNKASNWGCTWRILVFGKVIEKTTSISKAIEIEKSIVRREIRTEGLRIR